MRDRIAIGATICHLAFMAAGCARLPEPTFTLSEQTTKLKPEFQKQITKMLAEQCGRPMAPKLLGSTAATQDHLRRGAEVFSRYCVQCHGVNGDGKGVAATYLLPKPRNYLFGSFQVHFDNLRLEAASCRYSANSAAGNTRHLDAGISAVCTQRPRIGCRLRSCAYASGRAGDRAGKPGGVRRQD